MFTYTDLPGVQFYIGNYISDSQGKNGAVYGKRSGFCFETQFFPNAINTPSFETTLLKKNTIFTSKTTYKFDTI
jgi:aldose 1-epimerase